MKFIVLVLFSVVVLFSGSKNFLFLADYSVNRNFYEQLCINKNKPEMDCHGKCQMQKKSEKQNTSNELLKVSFDINLLQNKSVEISNLVFEFSEIQKIFSEYSSGNLQPGYYQILPHPPQFLV